MSDETSPSQLSDEALAAQTAQALDPAATHTSEMGRRFLAKEEWAPRTKACGWDAVKQLYFPYHDYRGYWTMGIGHLITGSAERVRFDQGYTEAQVLSLFAEDLDKWEKALVAALVKNGVVGVFQHEFDAWISMGYNLGTGVYDPGRCSAFKAWCEGRIVEVPGLMLEWDHSSGQEDLNLKRRRAAEGYVFSHDYPNGTGANPDNADLAQYAAPLIDLRPTVWADEGDDRTHYADVA